MKLLILLLLIPSLFYGAEAYYGNIKIVYDNYSFYSQTCKVLNQISEIEDRYIASYNRVYLVGKFSDLVYMKAFKEIVEADNENIYSVYGMSRRVSNSDGYYWARYPNTIFITTGMKEWQTLKVIVHELIHLRYYNVYGQNRGYTDEGIARDAVTQLPNYYLEGYDPALFTDQTEAE